MKNSIVISTFILCSCLFQVNANFNAVDLARLYSHTEETIKFLELHYRDVEAEAIRSDQSLLKRLVAQVEAMPNDIKYLKLKATLSHQLQMTIIRLASEVDKVTTRSIRDVNDVITKAHILIKQAQEAVKYLNDQHRAQEANIIKPEIHQLEKLVGQLQVVTAGTTAYMLEKQINEIETRLSSELQHVHEDHSNPNVVGYAHDHDSVYLLHNGHALVKQVEEALKYLKTHERVQEANLIEKEEVTLRKLVTELENAPGGLSATHIMEQLSAIEHRMTKELESIHQTPIIEAYYEEVHGTHQKEVLLVRANLLLKQADSAIQQLKAQNRASESSVLEQDEALVKKFVTELEAAHASANLVQLETELRNAELRLLNEIKRLNVHFLQRRDLKQDLITKGGDLLKEASEAILKLDKVHNSHDSDIIKKDEEQIKKLMKELESASDTSLIHKLEHDLRLVELRMIYQLRNVNNPHHEQSSPQEYLKQILLQRATTLETMADEAIKSLRKADKISVVSELEKDEVNVKRLAKEIKSSQAGASLLHIEQELTSAENRLSTEINKAYHDLLKPVPHTVARREDKTDLLKQSETLLQTVRSVIEQLKIEDRQELAVGMEGVEKFLLGMGSQMRNFHPHTLLGREAQNILEHLLEKGEEMLEDGLKQINSNSIGHIH